MALYKQKKQTDGVTTSYHRILFITYTINSHVSIAVLSYIDDNSRSKEKSGTEFQPYRQVVTYETAAEEDMTVEKAYDYLKTLPEFEGADDV